MPDCEQTVHPETCPETCRINRWNVNKHYPHIDAETMTKETTYQVYLDYPRPFSVDLYDRHETKS